MDPISRAPDSLELQRRFERAVFCSVVALAIIVAGIAASLIRKKSKVAREH